MNNIIVISGPTASGKTRTSLILAKKIRKELGLDVCVVNFDSLLFYKELNIGTAKPTADELDEVEHHLIDITSAKCPMNASDYIKIATDKINELLKLNKVVLLAGGSGFYLRALIKGMYNGITASPEVKAKLDTLFKEEGIKPFLNILEQNDPQSFKVLHENDHYRVIRAVEFFWQTGNKISDEKKRMDDQDPYDLTTNIHPEWNLFFCHLDLPKNEHQIIIEKRTQQMFDDGLEREVKELLESGFTGKEKPIQSIGYKEMIDYYNNKFSSIDACKERIIISTRQLAKSQRTFFQKITNKNIYHPLNDEVKIVNDVFDFLKE